MQTAVGLRFLRTLARLGDAVPSYVDQSQPHRSRSASGPEAGGASPRPAAPSVRST